MWFKAAIALRTLTKERMGSNSSESFLFMIKSPLRLSSLISAGAAMFASDDLELCDECSQCYKLRSRCNGLSDTRQKDRNRTGTTDLLMSNYDMRLPFIPSASRNGGYGEEANHEPGTLIVQSKTWLPGENELRWRSVGIVDSHSAEALSHAHMPHYLLPRGRIIFSPCSIIGPFHHLTSLDVGREAAKCSTATRRTPANAKIILT